MTYTLHYAPDNASLIIRLALEHRGIAYDTALVNRAAEQQKSAAFRALNPNGQIPVLETPSGPMFETGAILLWLADTHGGLGPGVAAPERGAFLKWLFFVSNTLHPALRMMFYPEKYIAPDQAPELRSGLQMHLRQSFTQLNQIAETRPTWMGAADPTVIDFYVAALMRWPTLYPMNANRSWFSLADYPALADVCALVERLPATAVLQKAEGLGITPFTAPKYPNPPQGSAT